MQPLHVQKLPQTAPISDMRNRQSELLRMTEEGPVILMSRSKPSAILLSPDYWDAIAELLQQSQQSDAAQIPPLAVQPQGSQGAVQNDEAAIDALAEIAALAQPLGPNDLALNFDSYSEQVLGDNADQ